MSGGEWKPFKNISTALRNVPTSGESLLVADLTLRDYFAAHAPAASYHRASFSDTTGVLSEIAEWNYAYADAMLAQRTK